MSLKYTLEIELNLPRKKVIELFDNPNNLKKWQHGLQSFELIEGEAGEVGAKSRLLYLMGNRKIEMIETITARNLPEEFSGTYEADGVWNLVENYFHEIGPKKTKWVTKNEFRSSRFMMRVMASLMPGQFKKQSFQYMKWFKEFAEKKRKS